MKWGHNLALIIPDIMHDPPLLRDLETPFVEFSTRPFPTLSPPTPLSCQTGSVKHFTPGPSRSSLLLP